jgi:hypothetical protein
MGARTASSSGVEAPIAEQKTIAATNMAATRKTFD